MHLADINGDGRLDATSAYEQSHKVSVSLHPGYAQADDGEWPSKVVLPAGTGRILGGEDAIFADVDGDGRKDVIVGAESDNRVTVMFAPAALINGAWARMDLLVGTKVMRVAFGNVAGGGGPTAQAEIVVGGREVPNTAAIGYYELTTPASPRLASSWTYRFVKPVSWIMQLIVIDMEGDNDRDIVYTDREARPSARRPHREGAAVAEELGGQHDAQLGALPDQCRGEHHKWFDIGRWDADNDLDIVDCRSGRRSSNTHLWLNNGGGQSGRVVVSRRRPTSGMPAHHVRRISTKRVAARSRDHLLPRRGLSGVIWLHNAGTAAAPVWERGRSPAAAPGDGIKSTTWSGTTWTATATSTR